MPTEILKLNKDNPDVDKLVRVAQVLKSGGLAILPTETVYGVAASSMSNSGIKKLCDIKNRPKDKPFSLAISNIEEVENYVKNASLAAYKLMMKFWPGPLTIVLDSEKNESMGFRMPDNPVTLKIIDILGVGVYLPSANLSGNTPPVTVSEALNDLNDKVDLAVDTGKTRLALESTVVKIENNSYRILRESALKKQDIDNATKTKNILFVCSGNSCRSVMAEGLLKSALADRPDVKVSSAGVIALSGMGATDEVISLMAKEGIDVSKHIARRISPLILKSSDLVLVMEKFHEERIIQLVGGVKNRVFLLKEFAKIKDEDLNIIDPIGRSTEFYKSTFNIIKESVERVAKLV